MKLGPKAIFLGDLHVGVHGDSDWMYDIMVHSAKQVCAYAKKHKIKTLIQAGDWFDTRKAVSQRAMDFNRNVLVPMFQEVFDDVLVLVGNHDMHYKEKIHPNSVTELLGHHDKFTVVDKPITVTIGKTNVDLFPWMCKENREDIFEFIKNTTSTHCFGHWELSGYYFYQGIESSGEDPKFLDVYDEVYSGHFHTISDGGNVQYLGTPYTITNGDANDPRGFWIFDGKTGSIRCEYNTECWHFRLGFDAETWAVDPARYKNKTVKLVVEKAKGKKPVADLNKVLDIFENICHEFSYIHQNEIETEQQNADVKVDSIDKIIKNAVDDLDEEESVKKLVNSLLTGLHNEAYSGE